MTKQSKEELNRQLDYLQRAKELAKQKKDELGRNLKACVVTFGCQRNAKDS